MWIKKILRGEQPLAKALLLFWLLPQIVVLAIWLYAANFFEALFPWGYILPLLGLAIDGILGLGVSRARTAA